MTEQPQEGNNYTEEYIQETGTTTTYKVHRMISMTLTTDENLNNWVRLKGSNRSHVIELALHEFLTNHRAELPQNAVFHFHVTQTQERKKLKNSEEDRCMNGECTGFAVVKGFYKGEARTICRDCYDIDKQNPDWSFP